MNIGAVDRQPPVGVVERDGDLRRVHRQPGAGDVEDHIGHFLDAKALDALLAEDHLTASTMFDLPDPFGPTTAVIPLEIQTGSSGKL